MKEDSLLFEVHGLKLDPSEISGLQQIADYHDETIDKAIHRAIYYLFHDFFNFKGVYEKAYKKKAPTSPASSTGDGNTAD